MSRFFSPLPLVGVALLVGLPVGWRVFWAPSLALRAQGEGENHNPALQVTLLRAGLDPRALAAAGVPGASVGALIQAGLTTLNANSTALSAADAGFATSRPESDRLKRVIESGHGTQDDVALYAAASTAQQDAINARDLALEGIFEGAIASLSANQKTVLRNTKLNKSWALPTEFLVVARSQPDWVALRDTLAGEKYCAKYHEELASDAVSLLASVRASDAVANAKASLDANLTAVTSAWNAAVNQ